MHSADVVAPPTPGELWRGLPTGRALPQPLWLARHRALLVLLVLHVLGLPAWALAIGAWAPHMLVEVGVLAALSLVGWRSRSRDVAASAVSLGLVASAGLLVHIGDGLTVLHFHFFVVVTALALYQQWLPFALALGFTVLDHAVIGLVTPRGVYDDAFGLRSPLAAAVVHGSYVLLVAASSAIAWTWAERERQDAEARVEQEAARVRDSERRLSALLDNAPSAIFVKDLEGRFVQANRHMLATLHCAGADVLGRTSDQLFGTGALEVVDEHDASVLATRSASVRVERNVVGSGEERTFQVVKFPMLDEHGGVAAIAGIATDITDRVAAEEALRTSEEQLRQVFESGPVAQVVLSPDGLLLHANPAFCALTGYPATRLDGLHLSWLVEPRDRLALEHLRRRAVGELPDDGTPLRTEVRLARPDGEELHGRISLGPVVVEGRPTEVLVGMVEDVTAARRSAAALAHQATHDALTSLPNRALLLHRTAEMLDGPDGGAVALLFLDLDGFKEVNDSLGHDAGDVLLCAVAARLDAVRRPADVLARLGGDEFVLCADGVADPARAQDIAERMLDALRQPVLVGDRLVDVRGTVGITLGRGADGATPALLLRDADTALYDAKAAGRDRVAVFVPAMRERDERRRRLQADLAVALRGGSGLRLDLQPIADAATGRITTCEALIRWDHPDDGLLAPGDFLPLAAAKGLLPELDRWVLEESCRTAAGWATAAGPVSVAVNITPVTVRDGDLVAWVEAACARSGLAPERLVVELTETAVVERPAETSRVLAKLRRLGVRIALDDFGTGYSSMSHLRELPVDVVKIDRSFTAGAARNRRDAAIVRATADLAAALGASLVAEGVETEAQRAAVVAAGCTHVQGFHVSRPLPPDEVARLLARQVVAPPAPRGASDGAAVLRLR